MTFQKLWLCSAIAMSFVFAVPTHAQQGAFNYQTDFPKILAQTQDSTNALYFNKLLPRFQSNDTSLSDLEVLALLIGFTPDPDFMPYAYLETEGVIYALNDEGKFAEALAKCDSFLVHVPISQSAIMEKSYALFKLGQQDEADKHLAQHKRIMRAMSWSGTGLTPETAIFSLGPTDGQNYILKYLAGEIGFMGSGRDKHGNFVDILGFTPRDAAEGTQEVKLYFQIEHAVNRMFSPEDLKRMEELDKK